MILAAAELGELLLLRASPLFCGRRGKYFTRALRPLKHPGARLAFFAVAAHMLQDAMVALVKLDAGTAFGVPM